MTETEPHGCPRAHRMRRDRAALGRLPGRHGHANIGASRVGPADGLFGPAGWLPNARITEFIGPHDQDPAARLIGTPAASSCTASAGGGRRGRHCPASTVGSDMPMFLGAMIIGPGTAFLLSFRRVSGHRGWRPLQDARGQLQRRVIGGVMAVLACCRSGRLCDVDRALGQGVDALLQAHCCPRVGGSSSRPRCCSSTTRSTTVSSPRSGSAVAEHGKAIEFLIETNPGPGFGILLAIECSVASVRAGAPAAMVIQFLGGIHEIYFRTFSPHPA